MASNRPAIYVIWTLGAALVAGFGPTGIRVGSGQEMLTLEGDLGGVHDPS